MKIAESLTARTGDQYKSKDIRNLLQKLKDKVANGDNLEKELDLLRNNGEIIRVDKDTNTRFVNSLWVKTKSMKESMARIKPTVFQSDTTFLTNREGYKLMTEFDRVC